MNVFERIIAAVIPALCIAFALLYFHQTQDYGEFVSVRFPYTMGAAAIGLFSIVLIGEVRSLLRALAEDAGKARRKSLLAGLPPFRDRGWNPLYLFALTLIFAALFPVIKSIASFFFYIFGLRVVFRKADAKLLVLDLALIVILYVIFHDLLLILLPSGPIEETISAFVRSII